jgi:hypothetical protein
MGGERLWVSLLRIAGLENRYRSLQIAQGATLPLLQQHASRSAHTHTHQLFRLDCCFTRHYLHARSLSLSHSLFDLLDLHSIDHETFPNTPTLFFP